MWSLIISIQYISIILWIILSALGSDVSLTKTFLPIFFFIGFINYISHLYNNKLLINKKYLVIVVSLIFLSTFSSIINYIRMIKDIDIVLYSFIIPFSLFVCQFLIWQFPTSLIQIKKIINVLKIFFLINAIVTTLFFLLINVYKIIDLDLIWNLSIQNTVLMKIAGETWYRTPGIFEIGGTNGTFLLIFLSMGISKFYYMKKNKILNKYLIYIFIISILILFTLTRRTYLCLFISIFLLTTLKTFKNPSILKLLIYILSLALMMLGLFYINLKFHGILSLDSFYERLQFWYMSINNIIGDDIMNLFVGLNILQSALKHSIMSLYTYSILDNGFIECIMHSGIFFTLVFIIYITLLLRDNVKLLSKQVSQELKWIPLFNILMLINMFLLMLFSTFIFNITESFVYFILINYFTKYLLDSQNNLRTS